MREYLENHRHFTKVIQMNNKQMKKVLITFSIKKTQVKSLLRCNFSQLG